MLCMWVGNELEFEKLFDEDLEPHPTHPLLPDGGAIGEDGSEGGEYEPLGGGVQPGGFMLKGSLPVGVIIMCLVSWCILLYGAR